MKEEYKNAKIIYNKSLAASVEICEECRSLIGGNPKLLKTEDGRIIGFHIYCFTRVFVPKSEYELKKPQKKKRKKKSLTRQQREARSREMKNQRIKETFSRIESRSSIPSSSKYQKKNNPVKVTKSDGSQYIYNPKRAPISKELRQAIFDRDGYRCRYCGKTSDDRSLFQIDHVYPVSLGGETNMENCVVSCAPCNVKKSNDLGWEEKLSRKVVSATSP